MHTALPTAPSIDTGVLAAHGVAGSVRETGPVFELQEIALAARHLADQHTETAGTRARRQKWIDQAQSRNIYMASASDKKLDDSCKLAWIRGLKTTYYLRTLSASHAEKSTVNSARMNAAPCGRTAHERVGSVSALERAAAAAKLQFATGPATDIRFCGVDDPICESCQ